MNIVLKKHETHTEITIRDVSGKILHAYTFDTYNEALAFMNGWRTCQSVINGLVQSLPQSPTR